MSVLGKILAALVLAASLGSTAAQAVEPDVPEQYRQFLTEENIAKLEAGELVFIKRKDIAGEGDAPTYAHGNVFVIINRPAQAVWDGLVDYEARAEYLPRVIKIEKYGEKDGAIGIHVTFRAALRKLSYYAWEVQDAENHVLTWSLDPEKKNDLDRNQGSWYTLPYDDKRCLVIYDVQLESSLPLPGPLERYMINNDTPEVIEALRKRAESDGTYKK